MNLKNNKAITLIALVITIIVLLILAGVSINMISGDDGIISKASDAAEITKENSKVEGEKLSDAKDYIDGKVNQANSNSSLSHSGTVKQEAYYANLNTSTFYDVMPETVSDGDIYLFEDYLYIYNTSSNGWYVHLATNDFGITTYVPDYPVKDRNQTSYGSILEYINNIPITNLSHTFENCTSLTDLSDIVIPSSIFCVNSTFKGCTNLTTAPVIPNSNQLYEFYSVFEGCTSLTGNVTINSNPTSVSYAFEGTVKPITITGSCSTETKANLAATANNNNVTY